MAKQANVGLTNCTAIIPCLYDAIEVFFRWIELIIIMTASTGNRYNSPARLHRKLMYLIALSVDNPTVLW